MPRPRFLTSLKVNIDLGSIVGVTEKYLDVKVNENKSGDKFFIEVPSYLPRQAAEIFMNELDQKSYAYGVEISKSMDFIEFYVRGGLSKWVEQDLRTKIEEILQNAITEVETKKAYLSQGATKGNYTEIPTFTDQDIKGIEVGDIVQYQDENDKVVNVTITKIINEGLFQADVTKEGESSVSSQVFTDSFLKDLREKGRIYNFLKASSKSIAAAAATPADAFPTDMGKISVAKIINQTQWSDGLKKSMLEDFLNSGYDTFGNLVGADKASTSRFIQTKIDGFASGKNTYLQANMLADILFAYADINDIPNPNPPAPAETQANVGEKIYGYLIIGANTGQLIEVIKLEAKSYEEKNNIYTFIIDGKIRISLPRNYFIVKGDIITFPKASRTILIKDIQPDKLIYNTLPSKIDESISISDFKIAQELGGIQVDLYFNLAEIFESKQMPKAAPAKVIEKAQSKSLSDDEKEIEELKKSISDLVLLKEMFSPVEFEETIKISQKIDEKQKKINDINLVIVDKKLKGNKIFDDLFEQSFTPIQHNYNVYVSSETENSDFFAPNGEKSNLKNSISSIIRTPLFKEWFGDWQLAYAYKDIENSGINCSKVLSENFEPLIVWHGTGTQFSYFRFDNFPAAYFAVNKSYSEWFANLQSGGNEGYTMPFFLSLKNPLDLTKFSTREIQTNEFFDYMYLMTGLKPEELDVNPIFLDPKMPKVQTWVYLRNNPKMLKKLAESEVYDGIHFYETNPSVPEGEEAHVTEAYITFNPDSCKIADPDRGDLILASMKSFLLKKGGKI